MLTIKEKEYKIRYRAKHPWMTSYHASMRRCNDKNFIAYRRYGGRGIKCHMTAKDFKFLWLRDKASLMKKPSIDRINNNKNYELNNCRFIELSENSGKDKRMPINQIDKNGLLIKKWESMNAPKKEGFSQESIWSCCNGQRKSHAGFRWEYANHVITKD